MTVRRMLSLLSLLSLVTAFEASAQTTYGWTPNRPTTSRTYLGRLSTNPYSSQSTGNPYSTYGSPYSSNSINNPYGAGNPYSNTKIYVHPSP